MKIISTKPLKPNQKEIFSTKDIGLAAMLQCKGIRLIDLDTQNPKEFYFCFEQSEKLDQMISDHYKGELMVSSLGLLNSFRNLKHLIHQQK